MRSVPNTGTTDIEQNVASTLSRFRCWVKKVVEAGFGAQRTEMTIQTDQLLIIRGHASTRGWCPECGREVDMLGLKEAEALGGAPHPLTIQPLLPGWAVSRGWHWSQAPDGSPQVCLESVLKSGN